MLALGAARSPASGVLLAASAVEKYTAEEKQVTFDQAGKLGSLERDEVRRAVAQEMYGTGGRDGDPEDDRAAVEARVVRAVELYPSQTSILYMKALSQMLSMAVALEGGGEKRPIMELIGRAGVMPAVDIEAIMAPSVEEGRRLTRTRILDGHHRWASLLLALGDKAQVVGNELKHNGEAIEAPTATKILNTVTAGIQDDLHAAGKRRGKSGPGELRDFNRGSVEALLRCAVRRGLPCGAQRTDPARTVIDYMIQPVVELYGGGMAVLKVS
jgi:hypothetical protein